MLHGVLELLDAKDVDVEVVRAVIEVAVEDVDQVGGALLVVVAKGRRVDGLRVGDAVEGVLVGELGHGVEGSEKAVLLSAVGGVGARGERGERLAAVGGAAGSLAVDHVGGDGQDRGGRLGVAVGVVLGDLGHERLEQPDGDVVDAVVVVAVLGEVTLDLVVDDDALLVADGLDLGVLHGRDGVDDVGEARDAGREGAADVGVDEGHLGGLVVVLVVHVLDEVQDVDVQLGQPVHHEVELVHDLVVVEVLGSDRGVLRADLHVVALLVHELLVLAAVDGVVEALGKVGAGTEELHLLAGLGSGDAAADGVVVAPDRTHDVVVLILDRGRGDGDLGGVLAEVLLETLAVENGQVRLGSGAHVLEGVQETVVVLGDERTAVLAEASDLKGGPNRVAGEELLVARDAGELDHAELEDEVVDELLGLGLGDLAGLEVTLDVDVQEGGDAAHGHGGAVLGLDGGEIAEIEPLDGLGGVGGRLGDVVAVDLGHLLHALESTNLVGELLALTNDVIGHGAVAAVLKVGLLAGDEAVNAVEGDAAVVADDAAAAIGVGQAGDDVGVTGSAHLGGVRIEDALVVGLVVLVEDLRVLVVHVEAVVLGRLLGHLDAAVGHEGALEGLVGLEADDLLEVLGVLTDVARAVGGQAGDDLGLALEDAVVGALGSLELLDLAPELVGGVGRTLEERVVAVVDGVVLLDEVADVDVVHPVTTLEAVPLFAKLHSHASFCSARPPGGPRRIYDLIQRNAVRGKSFGARRLSLR